MFQHLWPARDLWVVLTRGTLLGQHSYGAAVHLCCLSRSASRASPTPAHLPLLPSYTSTELFRLDGQPCLGCGATLPERCTLKVIVTLLTRHSYGTALASRPVIKGLKLFSCSLVDMPIPNSTIQDLEAARAACRPSATRCSLLSSSNLMAAIWPMNSISGSSSALTSRTC